VNDIEELGALDTSTKEQVATWWRCNDERLHGVGVIERAEAMGRYRKEVTLVRRVDGNIVGVATGKCSLGLGYLFELIVDEQHQGNGIGTALLAAFEDTCRRHECFSLALRTQCPRAMAFYEHNGWELEFTSSDWFGGIPTHQMRKSLTN
jgi:GNAT superfamily N-acetyltransferase